MTTKTPSRWPGDSNAVFGFGTSILVNLLVLTGRPAGPADGAPEGTTR